MSETAQTTKNETAQTTKEAKTDALVAEPAGGLSSAALSHQLKADIRIWIRSAVAAVAPNRFAVDWFALPRRSVSWAS